MCKFTHRLFNFSLVLLLLLHLQWTSAAPSVTHKKDQRLFSELLEQDYDYDLHYDQRQKGNENLRLKLDGFVIGLPAQQSGGLLLLTDDLLEKMGNELLLGLGKNRDSSTSAPENALNYNNKIMEQEEQKLPLASQAEAIIVKIPAPLKDLEARHQRVGTELPEEGETNASRTKFHIFHLLNFLRGNKKV